MSSDADIYKHQNFGNSLGMGAKIAMLIVDFVNGFADPQRFGGGNIPEAIAATVPVLETARERGWPVAHTRIVFANDDADANVFTLKVPGLLGLKETDPASAIAPELAPVAGERVVRKTVPSAFFGTGLAAWLTQHGVSSLLVAGCTTSGCVRATVVDGLQNGFPVVVPEQAVGDRNSSAHRSNLYDLNAKYADVVDLDTAIGLLP